MKSIQLDVEIRGRDITIINNNKGSIFPVNEIIESGKLLYHPKFKEWIISNSSEDSNAIEIGGCSDGPAVVDLIDKIYWTC